MTLFWVNWMDFSLWWAVGCIFAAPLIWNILARYSPFSSLFSPQPPHTHFLEKICFMFHTYVFLAHLGGDLMTGRNTKHTSSRDLQVGTLIMVVMDLLSGSFSSLSTVTTRMHTMNHISLQFLFLGFTHGRLIGFGQSGPGT
jgi:hypothetical protein